MSHMTKVYSVKTNLHPEWKPSSRFAPLSLRPLRTLLPSLVFHHICFMVACITALCIKKRVEKEHQAMQTLCYVYGLVFVALDSSLSLLRMLSHARRRRCEHVLRISPNDDCCHYILQNCAQIADDFGLRTLAPWAGLDLMMKVTVMFVFHSLESAHEEADHAIFVATMRAHETEVSPAVFAELKQAIGDPDDPLWRNWDLAGSAYFTYTLASTIGYGTFAPKTDGGKAFTICISGILIFAMAVLIRSTGKYFCLGLYGWRMRVLRFRVEKHFYNLVHQIHSVDPDETDSTPLTKGEIAELVSIMAEDRAFKIGALALTVAVSNVGNGEGELTRGELQKLFTLIWQRHVDRHMLGFNVCLLVIFGGVLPAISPPLPGWTHLDGLYWSVVTFTSVGFGDFVIESPTAGTRLHFPYSAGEAFPVDFSRWEKWLDPVYLFYISGVLILIGAVINSASDAISHKRVLYQVTQLISSAHHARVHLREAIAHTAHACKSHVFTPRRYSVSHKSHKLHMPHMPHKLHMPHVHMPHRPHILHMPPHASHASHASHSPHSPHSPGSPPHPPHPPHSSHMPITGQDEPLDRRDGRSQ